MTLAEQVQASLTEAMRNQDALRRDTLRMVSAAAYNAEKSARRPLTDDEYLAVLTRRPTPEEAAHFEAALKDRDLNRPQRLEDLFWALLNSTEFSWNH